MSKETICSRELWVYCDVSNVYTSNTSRIWSVLWNTIDFIKTRKNGDFLSKETICSRKLWVYCDMSNVYTSNTSRIWSEFLYAGWSTEFCYLHLQNESVKQTLPNNLILGYLGNLPNNLILGYFNLRCRRRLRVMIKRFLGLYFWKKYHGVSFFWKKIHILLIILISKLKINPRCSFELMQHSYVITTQLVGFTRSFPPFSWIFFLEEVSLNILSF